MTARGPFRDGLVHVLDGKCATCIFRPGNRMRLKPGRVAEMIRNARAKDTAITCHETYNRDPAVCRGFWDTQRGHIWPLRLAQHLGLIRFDPAPAPHRFHDRDGP